MLSFKFIFFVLSLKRNPSSASSLLARYRRLVLLAFFLRQPHFLLYIITPQVDRERTSERAAFRKAYEYDDDFACSTQYNKTPQKAKQNIIQQAEENRKKQKLLDIIINF